MRCIILRILLWSLGQVTALAQLVDPGLREQWRIYPEQTGIALYPWPTARPLLLRKRSGRFRPLSRSASRTAPVTEYIITFKSARIAWPVLTGHKRIEQAFLEHGMTITGDLMHILPLVRGILRVERMIGMRPSWSWGVGRTVVREQL